MNLPRWRNTFAFLLLVVLLVPILAACGGTATPATTEATTPAETEATVAAPETEATAAEAEATPAETEAETPEPAETEAAAEETPDAAAAAGDAEPTNADCGVETPGSCLRMNWGADPDTIDPQVASFVSSIRFIMLNYLPLMTFNTELEVVPGAAESYELSEDQTTFTFTLRPDMQYSDGEPLTAANFEYAFKRWCDPNTAGEYTSLAYPIVGCQEYFEAFDTGGLTVTDEAELQSLRDAVGVRAVDDTTLEVQLDEPAPYFLNVFALWGGAPVREDLVEAGGESWWTDPANYIGNGPFQLVEWDPQSRTRWERNENYVLDPPGFEAIETVAINESNVSFEAYRAGELDIVGVAAEDLETVQGDEELNAQFSLTSGSCNFGLHFNNAVPPFDNQQVRMAFAKAIDREAYVRDILRGLGLPTTTFIPPGMPGHDPDDDTQAFDVDEAKRLLEESGVDVSQPFKMTFSASARNQARYEYLAAMLQDNLGVQITLEPIDPTQYQSLFSEPETTPQMYILGWCADYPDPQNWVSLVYQTGGITAGDIGYSNPQLDELTKEADLLPLDDPRRMELYQEAQRLLTQDAPVAFMWNDVTPWLIKPWVQGMNLTPLDYFPGIFALEEISIVTE